MPTAKDIVRKGVRGLGFDLVRYPPPDLHNIHTRRARLIERYAVDSVLDIGANEGQYGYLVRDHGFRGRLISFEPLAEPFAALERRAAGDPRWECLRLALGGERGRAEMNVARLSAASSLLEAEDWFVEGLPIAERVGTESVEIATLDEISPELLDPDSRVLLKLDVQGYEEQVLAGAEETLDRVVLLEQELSLIPLYEGESGILEALENLRDLGFSPVSLEPAGYLPESGEVPQVDGLFVRAD
jgi:FkbM family methyltransferase